MTADNVPVASTGTPPNSPKVASCTYLIGASNNMITLTGLNNWIFDNFEMTGHCVNTTPNQANNNMFRMYGASFPNNDYVLRNYTHGWSRAGSGEQATETQYNSAAGAGPGWHFWFNVSDGTDADWYSSSIWGGTFDGWDLAYNVVRYQGAANVSNNCHYAHDNLFEYMQNTTDGSTHTDVLFCYGEYRGGNSAPNIFWNNTYRYIGTLNSQTLSYVQSQLVPTGQTDYVFNTLIYQSQLTGNGTLGLADNGASPGSWSGAIIYFNLTGTAGSFPIFETDNPGQNAITSVNNHFISSTGTQSSIWQSTTGLTESEALYMTNSTATADGYTISNSYQPTSSSSPTVTASGTNETAGYCADSVLHYAIAEAACVQGITGVSYNATTHTVVYPAFAAVSRPSSGSSNAGAYQFGSSTSSQPEAPAGLVAAVE